MSQPSEPSSRPESDADRRHYPRFAAEPGLYPVLARRWGELDPLAGHLRDVSLGGARIAVDARMDEGESIEVELQLRGVDEAVRVRCRVVRGCEPRRNPRPRDFALRFVRFAGEHDERRLRTHIGDGWLREGGKSAG